jgi:hypothetical protein
MAPSGATLRESNPMCIMYSRLEHVRRTEGGLDPVHLSFGVARHAEGLFGALGGLV